MGYPAMQSWIRLKKRSDQHWILYDDLYRTKEGIDADLAGFLLRLDGKTDPGSLRQYSAATRKEYLQELDRLNAIRSGRILYRDKTCLLLRIFRLRGTIPLVLLARLVNTLLILLWFPSLIFGWYTLGDLSLSLALPDHFRMLILFLDLVLALFLTMLLHEAGHMVACMAGRGKAFEIGIGLDPGPVAFFLGTLPGNASFWQRLQYSAAGLEMNCVLFGLAGFLTHRLPDTAAGTFFFLLFYVNLLGVLGNLLPYHGTDGLRLYQQLFFDTKDRSGRRNRKKGKAAAKAKNRFRMLQMASFFCAVLLLLGFFFSSETIGLLIFYVPYLLFQLNPLWILGPVLLLLIPVLSVLMRRGLCRSFYIQVFLVSFALYVPAGTGTGLFCFRFLLQEDFQFLAVLTCSAGISLWMVLGLLLLEGLILHIFFPAAAHSSRKPRRAAR